MEAGDTVRLPPCLFLVYVLVQADLTPAAPEHLQERKNPTVSSIGIYNPDILFIALQMLIFISAGFQIRQNRGELLTIEPSLHSQLSTLNFSSPSGESEGGLPLLVSLRNFTCVVATYNTCRLLMTLQLWCKARAEKGPFYAEPMPKVVQDS